MTALVIALSPFLSSAITGFLKMLPPFASLSQEARTPIIRVLGAIVSLVYVVVGMWITGGYSQDTITNEINTLVFALMSWLGSLGVFHAFFQKAIAPAPAA